MKKRTFLFDCSLGAGEKLIEILNHYADAAYPVGGSDCAAASRQGLFDIADLIREAIDNDGVAHIGRRQKPVLKAAVKWFYSEVEKTDDQIKEILFEQLL